MNRRTKKPEPFTRRLRFESLEARRVLATFTVTSLGDAGPHTLRRAVQQADVLPGEDTIIFDQSVTGGTIQLLSQIDIAEAVTIDASLIGGINIDLTNGDATPGIADGQGIRAFSGADFSIRRLTIIGGDTPDGGGALRTVGNLTVFESTLANNTADVGGAIWAMGAAVDVVVSDSVLDSNIAASGDGGAIHFNNYVSNVGGLDVINSTLTNNSSAGNGGAIWATVGFYAPDATVVDSTLADNTASANGGAIYIKGDWTLMDSTVTGNVAGGGGGGISSTIANYAYTAIERTVIANNSAHDAGGGLFVSGGFMFVGGARVRESSVLNNTAGGDGGGVSGPVGIEDTTIDSNSSGANGGGVNGAGLNRVTLSNNSAAGDGGGAFFFGSGGLRYSTVSGNVANGSGGGLRFQTSSVTTGGILSSTITGNTANADGSGPGGGGGVYLGSNFIIFDVHDTILANNIRISGAAPLPEDIAGYNGASFRYSLVEANPQGLTINGPGNIVGADPLLGPLADNGGPTLTHALLSGSTAIDTGDPMFTGPPYTDQRGAGYIRVQDGDGDAMVRLDMGAYEVQGPNLTPVADAGDDVATVQSLPVTLDGTNSFDPDDRPQPLSYTWEVISGPGPAELGSPNSATTSFAAGEIGDYVVQLTVSDGALSSTDTVEVTVDFNTPPVADASLSDIDGIVGLPVILDGSLTVDPDDEPLVYLWEFVAAPPGSSAMIADTTEEVTFFFPDEIGIYTVDLTVCDSHQCDGTDPFDIVVSTEPVPGDFNGDGILNGDDIDELSVCLLNNCQDLRFDLDGNGIVDEQDRDIHFALLGTRPGDANLDGFTDGQDFIIWNGNKFTTNDPLELGVGWATADFNGDGATDGQDFIIWNGNKFQASDEAALIVLPKRTDQALQIDETRDVELRYDTIWSVPNVAPRLVPLTANRVEAIFSASHRGHDQLEERLQAKSFENLGDDLPIKSTLFPFPIRLALVQPVSR